MDQPTRILIVGASGSGKTTFARELCRHTGLPLLELDSIYWGPNWSRPSPEAFGKALNQAIQPPGWIIEGDCDLHSHQVWQAADLLIWLDLPLWQVFARTLWRSLKSVHPRKTLGRQHRRVSPHLFIAGVRLALGATEPLSTPTPISGKNLRSRKPSSDDLPGDHIPPGQRASGQPLPAADPLARDPQGAAPDADFARGELAPVLII